MEKETIENMVKEFMGDVSIDEHRLINWLYHNGYEVVKKADTSPKSRFMEEWIEFYKSNIDGFKDSSRMNLVAIRQLAQLIDKHMVVKPDIDDLVTAEEIEEAKKRC